MFQDLEPILTAFVEEMTDDNTVGFILGGSHARGEASAHSDVDVRRFVRTPVDIKKRYLIRGSYLFEYSVSTPTKVWDEIGNPARAIWYVPVLRQARILRDSDDQLAALKQAAMDFQWEPLQVAADAHASYALHMMVETIFKAINAFDSPQILARNLFWLTEPITELVAVQRGVLFRSSKSYLPQVQAAMGEDSVWTKYHREAFDARRSVEERTRSGLWLFVETARVFEPILKPEDRQVIEAAVFRARSFLAQS